MLCFGLKRGVKKCTPYGEIFRNSNFDCGLDYWKPNEPETILTDHGDGTITVASDGTWEFASINPVDEVIPAGTYHIKVVVTAINGRAKFSYYTNGWVNEMLFDTVGTHEKDFTISMPTSQIDIGINGDASFTVTFDEISLTRVTNKITTDNGEPLTTDDGEELTV